MHGVQRHEDLSRVLRLDFLVSGRDRGSEVHVVRDGLAFGRGQLGKAVLVFVVPTPTELHPEACERYLGIDDTLRVLPAADVAGAVAEKDPALHTSAVVSAESPVTSRRKLLPFIKHNTIHKTKVSEK